MRNRRLDFVRGIAVLVVVFYHHPFGHTYLIKNGGSGVTLFFVLSGFLVAGLLFKEIERYGSFNLKLFLIRRGFKIYPLYYLLIILHVLITEVATRIAHTPSVFITDTSYVKKLFYEITFTQNLFGSLIGHTWSLGVEEHFYFTFPLIVLLLIKLKVLKVAWVYPLVWGFTAIVCSAFRYYYFDLEPGKYSNSIAYVTHVHYDALMFGTMLSYYFHYYPVQFKALFKKIQNWLYLPAAAIISWKIWSPEYPQLSTSYSYVLLYVSFGFYVINFSFYAKIPDYLKGKLFRLVFGSVVFVGFYSYGIYIYHGLCTLYPLRVINKFAHMNPALDFAVYLTLALTGSVIISKLVEHPFLELREKYFPATGRKLKKT